MKRIFAALFFVSVLWSIGALEVDREELQVDPAVRIRFRNYEGVPEKIETRDQIRGIGLALGRDTRTAGRRYFDKYRAIRAADPSVLTGFDADIIIIERTAVVDHIRNLRLIIAGFITAVHGYSEKDSNLLAEYITIYNAVYRKNIDYFKENYKPVVLSHLEAERVGLALSYDEWPGYTQIVIPLSDPAVAGTLSVVETGVITDEKVLEELRTREDKGVEIRKEMVDLKERQIEQEEKIAGEEKKTLREDRDRIAEEEKRVTEELAKVEAEKKAAAFPETSKPEAAEPGDPAQSAQSPVPPAGPTPVVGETEKEASPEDKPAQLAALEKKEEDLVREQTRIEEEKKDVEKREESVAAREEIIEEKKEEVRRDRTEIAADQQTILDKETAGMVSGIPFIKIGEGPGGAVGKLVLINPRTGEVLMVSPESPLTVKNYEAFGGGIAVIQARGDSGGRLVILDRASLKEKIAAREEVYPRSSFRVQKGELFVVIKDSGDWYVGKYDEALALLSRSKIKVNPATFILIADEILFIESSDGRIVPLGLAGMD